MKKNLLAAFSFVLILTLALVGCGNTNTQPETKTSPESNVKNEEGKESASGSITAVGSSALQPLVEAAAQQFAAENAGAVINVQGGGSGTGLSKISEGAVDIGNSDVFAEEKEGIPAEKLVDHKVAVVGMGPVTHPEVGVKDITQDQLIDIFTGKVTNWKELGGKDQKIVIINRAQGSGTRATFEQFGLKGAEPIAAQEQDSSGTVRKIVSETPGAISYLAFSYFDDSIVALSLDGNEPTQENVETDAWKIWAYQHMYTNGEATGLTKAFIDYILSPEIQDTLVKEMDYLPVTGMKVERDAEGNVK
ncbi:phosphate ABC transporter substrate-binding protein [Lederbergia citrea]|uniref:Phosphate-binding protein n=1 Tax=Lederbergia citrea TaxID=2833581 RepID=A0A942UQA0_9BACI|nr:phosphate ABC transporter substrate-binding protein [Lederbergia citrea]MBS4178394.1 phosphate ABC transporter substrate-binding protein [Lederbergia citrea]MBS4205069.1 phosphate ABC transporter substrate-binding protein [Lederbergia citrea]MBS4223076.1 phosphate ABC transporter substrate-binding protein [Lederbergia citrea]